MINDMFESKTVVKLNEDTWIIPEGYRIVKIPKTADLMERIHEVCSSSSDSCHGCPLKKAENECIVAYKTPNEWDLDDIRRRFEEAGR